MKEHGIISSWWEYDALPGNVLDDARLLMEADAIEAKRRQQENQFTRRGRR